MNAKKRRELADEARTLCEDISYGYVHDWMQQHPGGLGMDKSKCILTVKIKRRNSGRKIYQYPQFEISAV